MKKRLQKKVLNLESVFSKMTDEQLKEKTAEFKERLKKGESLNHLLPEAFACVRETAWRVLGEKPYPVQVLGGIVLHQGKVAQMQTGEGKTLTAVLPVYLNALTGKGVHVVTVNPYLAERDKQKMEKVYRFLGLSTGLVIDGMDIEERKKEYRKDITYVTNDQLGFDYLKDHMAGLSSNCVLREFHYAIIDEVDSILIDEARTPLIIANQGEDRETFCCEVDAFVKNLTMECVRELQRNQHVEEQTTDETDYVVDEKNKSVILTNRGIQKAQEHWNVEDITAIENISLFHMLNQSLRAHGLMKKDVDYVVMEDEVAIVDECTGRIMDGRRFNDGLHQALEAKEGVTVKKDNETQAAVTYQNFFRLYEKISGMTGTAMTEKAEFREIYGLSVVKIPTNKPVLRKDLPLRVYLSEDEKEQAVIELIKECYKKRQPVLVGTPSVEKNERLVKKLKSQTRIPVQILNAKNDKEEAKIIAAAGKRGTVTIATNMAGRGTDILLGGNPVFEAKEELKKDDLALRILLNPEEPDEVTEDDIDALLEKADSPEETDDVIIKEAKKMFRECLEHHKAECKVAGDDVRELGGLYVIGLELHENRRIDDQLRGRSGRQGDPGTSVFFASCEDNLYRLFTKEGLNIPSELKTGEEIKGKHLKKHFLNAQLRLENAHFEGRKDVLQFDDVLNEHRIKFYEMREHILENRFPEDGTARIAAEVLSVYMNEIDMKDINKNVDAFLSSINLLLNRLYVGLDRQQLEEWYTANEKLLKKHPKRVRKELLQVVFNAVMHLVSQAEDCCKDKEQVAYVKQQFLLANMDACWMQHLANMECLKKGIHNRSYGLNDPVTQYGIDGAELYKELIFHVKEGFIRHMVHMYRELLEQSRKEESVSAAGTEG